MLKWYICSVVIWMVIIWSTMEVTKDMIIENGWIKDSTNKKVNLLKHLFILSAIPVFRVVTLIMLWVMATKDIEWWENIQNKS